jgi:hypothetical protein
MQREKELRRVKVHQRRMDQFSVEKEKDTMD